MGFFGAQQIASAKGAESNDALYRRLECKACPLDQIKDNLHPHMPPSGVAKPLIYMLGEAPGKKEDEDDEQFVGKSGALLRGLIPREYRQQLRWNNVVRTRPPGNDLSEYRIAIECCRPSVERDIVASKPKAIFGFGNYPLAWVSGQNGIVKWRGRRMPVRIGSHTCWYFPFSHPAALLRMRKKNRRGEEYPSEPEKVFGFDLERAFSLFEELPAPRVWTAQEALANVELIECTPSGLARLEELLNWAAQQASVGLDYETWPVRPYAEGAVLLSAALGTEKRSFSFAFDHPGAKWTKAQKLKVRELWKRFLKSKAVKCVHNLKFEHEWTAVEFGREYLRASDWEDTYNQAAVLDERFGDQKPGCLSLEFLVQQHFGFNLKKLSNVNRKDLRKESLRDVLGYNGPDAKFHHLLWQSQKEELGFEKLQEVYQLDRRKIPALVLTSVKGVEIHTESNEELTAKYTGLKQAAEKEILAQPELKKFKQKFGKDFSPTSGPQLIQMLEHIMGRDEHIVEAEKEGEDETYEIDESVLARIDHPLTRAIIKHRKAAKVLSTYLIPYTADEKKGSLWPDGKIHTIFNQPGTVSDRTSSEDPNVQNIPKRDAESKEVRRQFRAGKGRVKVSADYGQIQFRGIAMMSRDKALVQYLWDEHDVHKDWAEEFAHAYPPIIGGKENLTDKAVMKNLRQITKNKFVFPSVFGAHIESRADYMRGDTKVDIPDRVMKEIDNRFWKQFHGIADWHAAMEKHYKRYGFVKAMSGRLFRGPLTKNQFINYPIQEVEAQIVVGHAMCEVSERAEREQDWNLQPELEIHDDLTFDLPAEEVDYYVPKIVTDMLSVNYPYINVPLTVEVSVGKDIFKMEEVLVASSARWFK